MQAEFTAWLLKQEALPHAQRCLLIDAQLVIKAAAPRSGTHATRILGLEMEGNLGDWLPELRRHISHLEKLIFMGEGELRFSRIQPAASTRSQRVYDLTIQPTPALGRHLLVVLEDVTTRVRLENEVGQLRQRNQELEEALQHAERQLAHVVQQIASFRHLGIDEEFPLPSRTSPLRQLPVEE